MNFQKYYYFILFIKHLNSYKHSVEITNKEINKALKSIKTNACGGDGIPMKIFVVVIPYILDVLKDIFNESVHEEVFPKEWRIARVVPPTKQPGPERLYFFILY